MGKAAAMEHPSGTQYVLQHGDAEAVITEVGGGVRVFRVGDLDVLEPYPLDAMCDGAHGQTLLPWPNRVADGTWSWDGQEHKLPLTEPDRRTAIHGLTRWANWRLEDRSNSALVLSLVLHPQTGWPFVLDCRLAYALDDEGLSVRTTVTNLGEQDAPVAAGAHPYLSAGGALVDECLLTLPGRAHLPTDARGLPVDRLPVAGTDRDFTSAQRIGDRVIDETFTDLVWTGERAVVTLERPDGRSVQLWAGPGYPYLEVFTGDTLAPDRRRTGLGIEPMTAPPNALQTGDDLVRLAPGAVLDLAWGARLA